jgi:hypothetical protein
VRELQPEEVMMMTTTMMMMMITFYGFYRQWPFILKEDKEDIRLALTL